MNKKSIDLISKMSYIERRQISFTNEMKILKFIFENHLCNAEPLAILINVCPEAAKNKLNAMNKKKLVKKHLIKFINYRKSFYSLMPTGFAQLRLETNDYDNKEFKYFEPSRINLLTINHKIQTMQTKAILLKNNLNYYSDNKFFDKSKFIISDIIISKFNIALEIELTLKSSLRYAQIIEKYLFAIKQNKFSEVIYIFLNEKLKNKLNLIFSRIASKNNFNIEKYFKFFNFQEFQNYIQFL